MSIPEFEQLLEKMRAIHSKKNEDYASSVNKFENFERSAELMNWFENRYDKSFVNLIGTKLARLSTLLNSNKEPNNESVEDSFLDLCTYCALWASYHKFMGGVTNEPDNIKWSATGSCLPTRK